jgi:anti-anti-sigma factor
MDAHSNGIPEALAITSCRSGDLVIIAVRGELDLDNVELLDQAIREAEDGDSKRIFLDLRELSFIDSTGLSLLRAHRRSSRIKFVLSSHNAVTVADRAHFGQRGISYPTSEPAG